jgi:hypothetical protein
MYSLLEKQERLTYISVGHRPSLLEYHDLKLRLLEHGYRWEKIKITRDGTGRLDLCSRQALGPGEVIFVYHHTFCILSGITSSGTVIALTGCVVTCGL